MRMRLTNLAAMIAAAALTGCGQSTVSAPHTEVPSATNAEPTVSPNTAPLAYVISQHSPLLDEAARTAISQDFNGAPLSGAPMQRQVTAENVRCRELNPPSGAPECSVTYGPEQLITIAGEDATTLFAALAAAGVQDAVATDGVTRELSALLCNVDDATAQGTPATGDQVAGFSCTFTPAP